MNTLIEKINQCKKLNTEWDPRSRIAKSMCMDSKKCLYTCLNSNECRLIYENYGT